MFCVQKWSMATTPIVLPIWTACVLLQPVQYVVVAGHHFVTDAEEKRLWERWTDRAGCAREIQHMRVCAPRNSAYTGLLLMCRLRVVTSIVSHPRLKLRNFLMTKAKRYCECSVHGMQRFVQRFVQLRRGLYVSTTWLYSKLEDY